MHRTTTIPLDLTPAAAALPPSAPRAFLDVEREADILRYPLMTGENRVGREGQDLAVPLAGGSVSRVHAVIECLKDGSCFLEDLKSTNKTYFVSDPAKGDAALTEAPPGRRYQLKPGCVIQFGSVRATLQPNTGEAAVQARLPTIVFTNPPNSSSAAAAGDGDTTDLDEEDAEDIQQAVAGSAEDDDDVPVVSKRQSRLASASAQAAAASPEALTLSPLPDETQCSPALVGSPAKSVSNVSAAEAAPIPDKVVRKKLEVTADSTIDDVPATAMDEDGPAPRSSSEPAEVISDTLVSEADAPAESPVRAPSRAAKLASQLSSDPPAADAPTANAAATAASPARTPSRKASRGASQDDAAVSSSSPKPAADDTESSPGAKWSLRSTDASPPKKAKTESSPKPPAKTGRSARLAQLKPGAAGSDDEPAPRWFFKRDLRFNDDHKDAWAPYSSGDSDALEKAFQAGKDSLKLNDKYTVDFKDKTQYRNDDSYKQRPVKRVI